MFIICTYNNCETRPELFNVKHLNYLSEQFATQLRISATLLMASVHVPHARIYMADRSGILSEHTGDLTTVNTRPGKISTGSDVRLLSKFAVNSLSCIARVCMGCLTWPRCSDPFESMIDMKNGRMRRKTVSGVLRSYLLRLISYLFVHSLLVAYAVTPPWVNWS